MQGSHARSSGVPSRRSAIVDVVFDGECGFCTRSAGWLQRLDRHGRLRLHPSQGDGVLRRFGLSEEDAKAAVWAFQAPEPVAGRPGYRYRGAAAANRAVDAALGIRLFVPIYRLAVIRWVQDRVYDWVVANRYRLPGATPWCQVHPEDCRRS